MKSLKLLLPGLLLAWLLPTACSHYGNELQYVKVGSVHLKIADAPFPASLVSSATITVVKIDARRAASEDEPSEAPFEVLFEGEETVDISELTNGATRSMGVSEIPVGTYDLIRVFISESALTLMDGRTFEVKVPSGSQSGVKLFVSPSLEVSGDEITEVLLDMDLSKSFVLRGNPSDMEGITGCIFKPVIRAVNLGYAGTVMGTVTDGGAADETPLADAQLSLFAADTLYTTTFSDAGGGYQLMGLQAGTYVLTASKAGFVESEEVEITVSEGSETTQDFSLIPE